MADTPLSRRKAEYRCLRGQHSGNQPCSSIQSLSCPPDCVRWGVGTMRNTFLSHRTKNPSNTFSQVFTRDDDPETKQQNCNLFSLLFLVLGMISFVTYFLQVSVYIISEDFANKYFIFMFVWFLLHDLGCNSLTVLPPLAFLLFSTLSPNTTLDLIRVKGCSVCYNKDGDIRTEAQGKFGAKYRWSI